jgi:hypothetical protein
MRLTGFARVGAALKLCALTYNNPPGARNSNPGKLRAMPNTSSAPIHTRPLNAARDTAAGNNAR